MASGYPSTPRQQPALTKAGPPRTPPAALSTADLTVAANACVRPDFVSACQPRHHAHLVPDTATVRFSAYLYQQANGQQHIPGSRQAPSAIGTPIMRVCNSTVR